MFIHHGKNDNFTGHEFPQLQINDYPDNLCVDFYGREFTDDEIDKLIHLAAVGLQKLGVVPGMTVGLMMPNSPYTVICTFAAIKAGAIVEHFSPDCSALKLARRIVETDTDIMITMDLCSTYDKVKKMLVDTSLKLAIICPMKSILSWPQRALYPILHHGEVADIPDDQWHVMFEDLIDNNNQLFPVAPS